MESVRKRLGRDGIESFRFKGSRFRVQGLTAVMEKNIQLCVLCDSREAPVKTGTSPALRDRQGGDIKEYFQQKNKNEIKKWTLQIFQTSNLPGSV